MHLDAVWIGYDENVFVSYLYPRFDCNINVSLFDLHGPSVVSYLLNKSAFMDLQLSDKASTSIKVPSYSRH